MGNIFAAIFFGFFGLAVWAFAIWAMIAGPWPMLILLIPLVSATGMILCDVLSGGIR